jgi:hypothetical protein
MKTRTRYGSVIASALALGMAAVGSASAAGWEMHEFESPLGDKGIALRVAAKRTPDVHLAIACDGDTGSRWRGVAVVEEPESKVGLGMSGDVRVRIGETSARDVWSVRTTETGRRVFLAAEATRLARRLLRAEASAPSAELAIEIPGVAGKPVALAFPLAGLRANVDKIAKRCDDWDLKETE